MRIRELSVEQWLPHPVGKVFDFFSRAENLEILTPPWLHFRILTEDLTEIHQDMWIRYRIRWRKIPIQWLTQITAWEPPYRFVDEQKKGPYRLWIHEHTFEAKEGGTLMKDQVKYALYGWILEPLTYRWIVRPDLEKIFEYRREKIAEVL